MPIASDVPRTAPERVAIIKTIVNAAKKIGLTDTDFLLDALVMTIAADEIAATETMQTLKAHIAKNLVILPQWA